jgi:hypothetical protein
MMIRNLKALGLAFFAVFAMTAVAASAAQASVHLKINSGETTGTIKVTQDTTKPTQLFETDVGAVECEGFHAHYAGSATLSSASTLEEVKYTECTVGGLAIAEVNFGTCDYTLSAPLEETGTDARGSVTLGPSGCGPVTITVKAPLSCTITVPGGQTFTNAITYTDVATGGIKEITGHANVTTGIHYSYSGTACGTGSGTTNGSYEGTFTATGYKTNGTQVNLETATT